MLEVVLVIIAPRRAFARLRFKPRWFWAFVVTAALGMAGCFLLTPVSHHITAISAAQKTTSVSSIQPSGYPLSAKRLASGWPAWLSCPLPVLFFTLISALIMLAVSAIGGLAGGFARCWSLAMHVAIIDWGIRQMAWGMIVYLRGVEAYSTERDVLRAVPSLAWLASGASPKLSFVFSIVDPFTVWAAGLFALAMIDGLGINKAVSWSVAAATLLLPAIVVAMFGSVI